MVLDDYKGINDYVHRCSDEELAEFYEKLMTIDDTKGTLVVDALDDESKERLITLQGQSQDVDEKI